MVVGAPTGRRPHVLPQGGEAQKLLPVEGLDDLRPALGVGAIVDEVVDVTASLVVGGAATGSEAPDDPVAETRVRIGLEASDPSHQDATHLLLLVSGRSATVARPLGQVVEQDRLEKMGMEVEASCGELTDGAASGTLLLRGDGAEQAAGRTHDGDSFLGAAE